MTYDKQYYVGNKKHCGSDIVKKYDLHWWSNRYYAGLIRKYLSSGTVLELGCAHGYVLAFLDSKKYLKLGMDISEYALDIARKNNPEGSFTLGSVENLTGINSESVNIVFSKYVFEHLHHPERAINESWRVLKQGGYLIFSVPNTSSLLRKAKGDSWIGIRDKTHVSVYSPEKWKALVEKTGFRIVKMFSDGFWDVPYIKRIPKFIQLLFFGWTTVLQVLCIGQWIPQKFGENIIVVAIKDT